MKTSRREKIQDASQWVKSIFKRSWLKYDVHRLISDFSNGVIIVHLAEALTCKKIPMLFPDPKYITEKVGNIEMALQAFKDDSVECPGIFAHDIANCDEEIIIMLCYILKHHYSRDKPNQDWSTDVDLYSQGLSSICMTKDAEFVSVDSGLDFMPFEKEDITVLDWVSQLIGKEVLDYQIFKDGVILCKLVNMVSPRKIPNKVIASASSTERIKLGLDFGFHELGIRSEFQPRDVLLGTKRAPFRKYLKKLRNIEIRQRKALENESRTFLSDTKSFADESLQSYLFYDLLKNSDLQQIRIRHSKDDWDISTPDAYIHNRAPREQSAPFGNAERTPTGMTFDTKKKPRSTQSWAPSLKSDNAEYVSKTKRQDLQGQLCDLQNSIQELKLKIKTPEFEPLNESSTDKRITTHSDRDIDTSSPRGVRNLGSLDRIAKRREVSLNPDDQKATKRDSEKGDRASEPSCGRSKAADLDCKVNVVQRATSDREHSETSGEKEPEENSSRKTSLRSEGTITHAATRFVRLSSRKPKGSVDDPNSS